MPEIPSMSKRLGIIIKSAFGVRWLMVISFGSLVFFIMAILMVARLYGIPMTTFKGCYEIEHKAAIGSLGLTADVNKLHVLSKYSILADHLMDLSRVVIDSGVSDKFFSVRDSNLPEKSDMAELWQNLESKDPNSWLPETMRYFARNHSEIAKVQVVDPKTQIILSSTASSDRGLIFQDPLIINDMMDSPGTIYATIHPSDDNKDESVLLLSTVVVSSDGRKATDETRLALLIYCNLNVFLINSLFIPQSLGSTVRLIVTTVDKQPLIVISKNNGLDGLDAQLTDKHDSLSSFLCSVCDDCGSNCFVSNEKKEILVACRNLELTEQLTLKLFITQDEAEALVGADFLTSHAFILQFYGLMLGGCLAVIIAQFITRPITGLTKAALAVKNGHLSSRAPRSLLPDLNFLAESFNSMVDEIQSSRDELESRVQQRTAQLEKLNFELSQEISRRKEIEEELRERERVMIQAQQVAHFGTWKWEISSGKLTWSEEIYRITGIEDFSTQVTHEDFLQMVHPDDRMSLKIAIKESLANLSSYAVEHRFVTRNGDIKHLYERGAVCVDESNQPIEMCGTVYDLTDIRVAEAELRTYAEEVSDLYNNAPCGYHSLDANGTFVRINDTELKWLGYSREEVINKMKLVDVLSDESIQEFLSSFERFKISGSIYGVELELKRKDGGRIPAIANATAITDSDGNFVMSRSTVFDISERKKVENVLRDSEQRFKTLFEASFEGIAISKDGLIIDANENLGAMMKCETSKLLGMSMTSLTSESYNDTITRHILQGDEHPYEAELVARDASVIPVVIRGRSTFFADSLATVISIRDISARKKAEREREELREQFFQAQKMEAIGILAGGVAHDFNNILTVVMGYCELAILLAKADTTMLHYVQKIHEAGNRAQALVKQILTFSRRSEHDLVNLQIAPVVKETIKFLRASIPSTMEIRNDIPQGLGLIKADPTQLHQVVMNLCANASQAMKNKGVLQINLSQENLENGLSVTSGELSPGFYIKLEITDTGMGIAPELQGHIFEPYFTTKQIGEGTGLGLAVVHGIVTRMGGQINVRSQLNVGTTFEIYFPVSSGEENATEETDLKLPVGNESILFVDDEPMIVEVVQRLLESLGYRVETRNGGKEAFELFQSQPARFDLVITDLTMPQMTGVDLGSKIRKLRPDIPIILCTGFGESMNDDILKSYAVDALVRKPIDSHDMAVKIRAAIDNSSKRSSVNKTVEQT